MTNVLTQFACNDSAAGVLAAIAVALAAVPAAAGPAVTDREVTYLLTPGTPDFASASWFETSDQYSNTTAGSGTANVSGSTGATGFTAFGLGGTTVTGLTYGINGSGQATASFSISSPGGSGNGYGYSQSLAVNAANGLKSSAVGGYDTLTMSANPSGGQANNSIVDVTIDIVGDWTAAADLVSYNTSGWSVLQDFVYSSATNRTVLQIETTTYQGSVPGPGPSIDFTLQGAFMPEPGSLTLLGAGIAGVLSVRRGKRAAAAG